MKITSNLCSQAYHLVFEKVEKNTQRIDHFSIHSSSQMCLKIWRQSQCWQKKLNTRAVEMNNQKLLTSFIGVCLAFFSLLIVCESARNELNEEKNTYTMLACHLMTFLMKTYSVTSTYFIIACFKRSLHLYRSKKWPDPWLMH